MTTESVEYTEQESFVAPHDQPRRAFGSPGRYVQGVDIISQAGHYLSRLGFNHTSVLMTKRCLQAEGGRLIESINSAGLKADILEFGGECSFEEISKHADTLKRQEDLADGLIAVGGGKVVDAGRAIAHRLGVPVVVVPTLASNDSPCAAVSVIYTPEGVTVDFETYDYSPVLVLVDTSVIAKADERYLVAGMADAMATWYEARACAMNPHGINVFGSRPTLAATALAELCAETIYKYGTEALQAVRCNHVSDALENIVEANTLLSGLGYESGGLAASHAVAQGYTVLEYVHKKFLHGEMVAMGVLTQLALESDAEELDKAAKFFRSIGLPVTLKQMGLSEDDVDDIKKIVDAAMAFPFIVNMNVDVTSDLLMDAILAADKHASGI